MENKKTMNTERFSFDWEPGDTYTFQGVRMTSPQKEMKEVWRGRFVDRAPKGLDCRKEYCLKCITVTSAEKTCPQRREYYDLVSFRGRHLRELIARNSNAVAVEQELRTGKLAKNARVCYVVEPAYEQTRDLFRDCRAIPPHLRLSYVGQYAEGCLELTEDPANRLDGCRVDAHRDVKPLNGVLDRDEQGEVLIRLIDYASIHLEKEVDRGSAIQWENPNDTYGGLLSRDNTAPEDLHHTPWQVGPTTDVYALGMMLAGLFLTSGGKYTNPNKLWIDRYWPDSEADYQGRDLLISQEFIRCRKFFDMKGNGEPWVEQALAERKIPVVWEDLPVPGLLDGIRSLVARAIRIDPALRISLKDFIEEIRALSRLARQDSGKFPVSIYLFEQTDFRRHAQDYIRAAQSVFEGEQERTGEPVKALCVSYHRSLGAAIASTDSPVCLETPCRDPRELAQAIARITDYNGRGQDMTVFALYTAGKCLKALEAEYAFTGNVYLFGKQIPEERDIARGVDGIRRICDKLYTFWEQAVYIDAYVIEPREDYQGQRWCTQTGIASKPEAAPTWSMEEDTFGTVRPPQQREMYMILPDGSKFWL